jgi:hypothetical protein
MKLYEMSIEVMLPLYRFLLRKLNKDALNVVLQYVFGDLKRFRSIEEGEKGSMMEEVCRENILSERDLDQFLHYELC